MSFNWTQSRKFIRPLLAFLLCAVAGNAQSRSLVLKRDSADVSSARQSHDREKERRFYRVLGNVAWVLGPKNAVAATLSLEQPQLGLSDKSRSVELSIRRTLITTSPEGQAALLSDACAVEAGLCDRLTVAVQGVADTRLVAPGNQLPQALIQGLPVRPGAYPPSHFH